MTQLDLNLKAFDEEIKNLRTLIAVEYQKADDQGACALEFAAKLVDRAEAALGLSDTGRTWLQLTGAIDFMTASGIETSELDRIRATVNRVFEAA